MNNKQLLFWISLAGIVGVGFGIFYALFGLNGLPLYRMFVPAQSYTAWSNGLYGAVFIGFSVIFFFVGRYSLQHKNNLLLQALLYGVLSWLVVEAAFSLYYGVYINVIVDIFLAFFLGFPLVAGMKMRGK